MNKSIFISIITISMSLPFASHAQNVKQMQWKQVCRITNSEWLKSDEAKSVADSVMKYQFSNGGWGKNQNWHTNPDATSFMLSQQSGIGATIDNGATWQEMLFLARMYSVTPYHRYRTAFIQGLMYLLDMQYDNGGFPQFHPIRKGVADYSAHITFNDGAMINVLRILKGIATGKEPYATLKLDSMTIQQAHEAYSRGLQCILDCQIRIDGEPTVWCMQHDYATLLPTKARTYELPSFCAHGETVEIINFLMDEEQPTAAVTYAIKKAIEWLEAHKIEDMQLESFINEEGKQDKRLVPCKGASPLWARFYDLVNAKPMFCDRDGKPQKQLSDIGYERRNGYQWVGNSPQKVIERYYSTKKTKRLLQ